jgi:uncharacterized protein YycO
MKKVSIGFSRPVKFKILSWLIRKVQRTEYSHAYIKFHSDSLDRDLIYQASGLQVNFVGKTLFEEDHVIVKEFDLQISDEAHKKALQFAVDRAGMPYSIKQLFGILIYNLTGNQVLKDGRSGYVCSELVAQMLSEDLGITITKDLDIVTPKDVYNILETYDG